MKVFKYELKIVDEQAIAMAYPATILTVMPDVENDRIMVYALADEDSAEFISRNFVVVGTAVPVDPDVRAPVLLGYSRGSHTVTQRPEAGHARTHAWILA